MDDLNQESLDDMKIYLNVTIGDIVVAVFSGMWEFVTLPVRWIRKQFTNIRLEDSIENLDAT